MTAREFAFIVSRAMGVYLFIGIMNVVPINIVNAAAALPRNYKGAWFSVWPSVGLLSVVIFLASALVLGQGGVARRSS